MHTVDGKIVLVVGSGAAGHHLCGGGGVDGDGVGTKEGVHVALVLAWNDQWINVLQHVLLGYHDGVAVGKTRRSGQDKQCRNHAQDWWKRTTGVSEKQAETKEQDPSLPEE